MGQFVDWLQVRTGIVYTLIAVIICNISGLIYNQIFPFLNQFIIAILWCILLVLILILIIIVSIKFMKQDNKDKQGQAPNLTTKRTSSMAFVKNKDSYTFKRRKF